MAYNRSDLVAAMAERSGLTKAQSDAALTALHETLVDALSKGEAVKVTGLISVERVERAARTTRNPRTGETVEVPAGFAVRIKPGSTLKNAVK